MLFRSIASFLNIPQVTYVKKFEQADGDVLTLIRELDDGIETVKVRYPALVCILQDTFEPRRPLINRIKYAQSKQIKVLTQEDINLPADECGLKGSPTYVSRAYRNQSKHNAQKYELPINESVNLFRTKIEQYSCSELESEISNIQRGEEDA
mgnify:CR=1 FL=1